MSEILEHLPAQTLVFLFRHQSILAQLLQLLELGAHPGRVRGRGVGGRRFRRGRGGAVLAVGLHQHGRVAIQFRMVSSGMLRRWMGTRYSAQPGLLKCTAIPI